jgi:hypothetical protein
MTDMDTPVSGDIGEIGFNPTVLGVTLAPQPNPATHDPREEYVCALVYPRNGAYLILWEETSLTVALRRNLAQMTDCARSAHVARKLTRATAQVIGYRALRWETVEEGEPFVLVGKFDRKTLKAALEQSSGE